MEQENINSVDASTTTENERRKKELENASNTVIELMGKETEKNWIGYSPCTKRAIQIARTLASQTCRRNISKI